ncbi:MAG: hypothetical protein HY050_00325 [Actinobacteria bacterium]|nr:hypothetical protein [Actinomycetota bacterium]
MRSPKVHGRVGLLRYLNCGFHLVISGTAKGADYLSIWIPLELMHTLAHEVASYLLSTNKSAAFTLDLNALFGPWRQGFLSS